MRTTPEQARYLERQARGGSDVAKRHLEGRNIPPGTEAIWRAFIALSQSRSLEPMTGHIPKISLQDMQAYFEMFGPNCPDQKERYRAALVAMDEVYISHGTS